MFNRQRGSAPIRGAALKVLLESKTYVEDFKLLTSANIAPFGDEFEQSLPSLQRCGLDRVAKASVFRKWQKSQSQRCHGHTVGYPKLQAPPLHGEDKEEIAEIEVRAQM